MISLQVTHRLTPGRTEPQGVSKQVVETVPLDEFVRASYVRDLWDAICRLGVVPPLHIINQLIARGPQDERVEDWTRIEVSEAEFQVLQRNLCDYSGGYCIEDRSLWACDGYQTWREALVAKIQANPGFKRLTFAMEHELLGIPLGRGRWLKRTKVDWERKAQNVDSILHPLSPFLRLLEHCTPLCCGIEAYAFDSEYILESCEKNGRIEPVRAIDAILIDLENQEPKNSQLHSTFMNCTLHRDDLIALLRHIEKTLCEVS